MSASESRSHDWSRSSSTSLARTHKRVAGLSQDEEINLIRLVQERDDKRALENLIVSFNVFILQKSNKVARSYGLEPDDVYQEGVIGFIEGVRRFDINSGFRLSTFSAYWIFAQISEYARRNNRFENAPVRLSANARIKLKEYDDFLRKNNLNEDRLSKEEYAQIEASFGKLASELQTMRRIFHSSARVSLDATIGNDGESKTTFGDMLVDTSDNQFDILNERMGRDLLMSFIDQADLKERERDIFLRRNLVDTPETLEVLGQEYGITRERIRQIEQRALGKLKKVIQIYMRHQFGNENLGSGALGII